MIYGYARVSTHGQDPGQQLDELKAAGCGAVFVETASGKSRKSRPRLAKVIASLKAGDVLMVTRLARLARSTLDALNILAAVTARGANFKSLREGWADTTTPAGRLMVTIAAGLAEFDREMILERTAEGRQAAKARGGRTGRLPTLSARQRAFVRQARHDKTMSLDDLARLLKVSRSTICRVAASDPAGDPMPAQRDIEELVTSDDPRGPSGLPVPTSESDPPSG
jgi:DNA invertase Pin-like site-specific DNA recombinase